MGGRKYELPTEEIEIMVLRLKSRIKEANANPVRCPDQKQVDDWDRHVREVAILVRNNVDGHGDLVEVTFCGYSREWQIKVKYVLDSVSLPDSMRFSPRIVFTNHASHGEHVPVETLIETAQMLRSDLIVNARTTFRALRAAYEE